MTTVGSLCSGIGGLDLACRAFGWDLAWHAEIDADAAKVHAARFGDLLNVGDIKAADWSTVPRVDVLCAGYPCQPFSAAGLRKGEDDPRHLWPHVQRAIAELRPGLVLLENVQGHVTKGLLTVLQGLHELGFDAEWGVLGSRDVGGCHRRLRLWIAATDPTRRGWQNGLLGRDASRQHVGPVDRAGDRDWTRAPAARVHDVGGIAGELAAVDLLPTPNAADGVGGRRAKNLTWKDGTAYRPSGAKAQVSLQEAVDLLPTPRTSDSNGAGAHGAGGPDLRTAIGQLLPTPTARDWKDGAPCVNVPENALLGRAVWGDFGRYQAAVDRWATIHGPAPAPTDDRGRLNPQFPEWMLGYPAGWVTDPELGLSRTAQLRMLGNSVQLQVAVVAYRQLIERLNENRGHMPEYLTDWSDQHLIEPDDAPDVDPIDLDTAPLEDIADLDDAPRPHPAKFSHTVIEQLTHLLPHHLGPGRFKIIDPFAGVGGVHELVGPYCSMRSADLQDDMEIDTWGVELEPEWANQHPRTLTGDSRDLHSLRDLGPWDAIVTSPAYGNRMADSYDGRDGSRRHTYRIDLGRDLSPANGGGMQWGDDYRALHSEVWASAAALIRPGGYAFINISNHIRAGREQPVVEWHLQSWLNLGWYAREVVDVQTRRMKHGRNGDARVDGEKILVLQKPTDAT